MGAVLRSRWRGYEDSRQRSRACWVGRRRLWLTFVAALVVVYSCWWAWSGGWLPGPRFFQFVYLALPLARAILAGSVALAGGYIK